MNPRAFGFLRREDGGEDLFLPPPITTAIDGDRVLVLLDREPRVLGALERQRRRAAGLWEGDGCVAPDDPKLPGQLLVPAGRFRPRKGDRVVVDLTASPVCLAEVLRARPGVDVEMLAAMVEAEVRTDFPQEVLDEAAKFVEPGKKEFRNRLDLRSETSIVTIDPVESKDFDDAVSIARDGRSGYRLGVHIADVSAYVSPGSAIDREAYARGNSVYLPARVYPMLPEALSNGICSLREGMARLTKSVLFRFDDQGGLRSFEIHRTVIRPFKRLTYERATAVMEGKGHEHPKVEASLRLMLELAEKLRKGRKDSLSLHRPEVAFTFDGRGRIVDVAEPDDGVAHGVIEEFMLAANQAVGEFLAQKKLPSLWRYHPEPSSLQSFVDFTRSLGVPWLPAHSLASYMRKIAGRPEARLVAQELLWAMPPAVYDDRWAGHFALGMNRYLHFTSPIRRYADLVVHRVLDFALGASRRKPGHLEEVARHLSEREKLASGLESRLRRRPVFDYLDTIDRGPHRGVVTQIRKEGIKVELGRFLVWGLLAWEDLPGRSWLRDELSAQNEQQLFRVGDSIHVRVQAVDRRNGRIRFVLDGQDGF